MFVDCIVNVCLCDCVVFVEVVVVLIQLGEIVVMSGFIGLGYFKVVLIVFVQCIEVVYVQG